MSNSKASNTAAVVEINKTNVRYITGSASRKDGAVVAIKFRVFGESVEIVNAVADRMTKLKATGKSGKLDTSKYSGWDLKKNVFYKEFVTKNRAEFQDAFKAAKRAAIELSRKALEVANDSALAGVAKAFAEATGGVAPEKKDKKVKVIKKNSKK